MSVGAPVASLIVADSARRRLAGRARWMRRYLLLQAALWSVAVFFGLVFAPTAGGYGGLVGLFLIIGLNSLVNRWAARQGVVFRGSRRLKRISQGATALVYLVVLFLGLARPPGDPAYWIPAAVVVAIPSLIAAVLAGRAAGPR